MAALLDGARPLVDLLWARETEGQIFDSPERKAALDKRLQDAIGKIPDEVTRNHYAEELRRKRWELFGGGARRGGERSFKGRGGQGRPARPALPIPATATDPQAAAALLEGASLLICALRPELIGPIETRLEHLTPHDPDRAALLFDLMGQTQSEAGRRGLETLRRDAHLGLTPAVIDAQDTETVAAILANLLDRLEAQRAIGAELARAEAEIQGEADEGLTWRMQQIARARHRAERPELEGGLDLNEDRDALSAQLSQFVDGQIWRKPPRR
ncbi:hypothetical protein ACFSYD_11305 [Paracoccus aerius]